MLAGSNQRIRIREKTLEFSSTVLSTLSQHLTVHSNKYKCKTNQKSEAGHSDNVSTGHIHVHRHTQTDGQPENIMPPATSIDGQRHSDVSANYEMVVSNIGLVLTVESSFSVHTTEDRQTDRQTHARTHARTHTI